jgi:hypothetical protein
MKDILPPHWQGEGEGDTHQQEGKTCCKDAYYHMDLNEKEGGF